MNNMETEGAIHYDPAIDNSVDDINAYLEGTDRSLYNFRDESTDYYKVDSGLTRDIVDKISEEKHDPEWMHEFRLKCLDIYNNLNVPQWGPPIDGLNMDNIVTYVRPNTDMKASWDQVPEEIKSAFDKLGIPQAEHEFLAGVGAQYDSELVYHNLQESVAKMGVVYSDMESALNGPYKDMVKEYFMHLVPPTDHKFAALHGAVWSGGSFVYIPKGVKVEVPLQSYFRLNAKGAGQFEHTLIIVDEGADLHFIEGCSAPKWNVANLHAGCVELYVKKNARLRYSTIENWAKNMYNLNTKRAIVEEGGRMEWVSGSFGSHVSYLYPTTILKGDKSSCEYTGITFSGKGQDLDTGCRMVHMGKRSSSLITAKSLAKDGGINTFRSEIKVLPEAEASKSSVDCQSLMLDDISRSDTIPEIDVRVDNCDIGHEAKIGRISDEAVFYLMSRGIPENEAKAMIVSGFANPISKELPLEYAAEMNNLIKLEMEGSMI
jgi:Fe-S cluster assembly protein SufB